MQYILLVFYYLFFLLLTVPYNLEETVVWMLFNELLKNIYVFPWECWQRMLPLIIQDCGLWCIRSNPNNWHSSTMMHLHREHQWLMIAEAAMMNTEYILTTSIVNLYIFIFFLRVSKYPCMLVCVFLCYR